jgi:hypothetical protein
VPDILSIRCRRLSSLKATRLIQISITDGRDLLFAACLSCILGFVFMAFSVGSADLIKR